jgi:hypothetical protein
MHNSTITLPNPVLQTHVEMTDSAIQPIVDRLSQVSPFISAGLFIEDNYYKGEAGTASIVNTPVVSPEFIDLTENSIRGRRVDLQSTVLGKVFASHESQFEISKLDPAHHLTWGVYTELRPGQGAVLQLVFDRQRAHLVDESTVLQCTNPYLKSIWAASKLLVDETRHTSLADELLLNLPATPNAYIIKWDVLGSTQHIRTNYPSFRHYLLRFELAIERLATRYGGRVTEYEGDGQNIIITLPKTINRSDLTSVGLFGRNVAHTFAKHITSLHDNLAPHYPQLSPQIRIALGLGRVEQLATGEVTGPIFWELAVLLRNGGHEELIINQAAQLVMKWSTSNNH